MINPFLKNYPKPLRDKAKEEIRKDLRKRGLLGRVISRRELQQAVDDLFRPLAILAGTEKFDPPRMPEHLRIRYEDALKEVTHVPNIENYPRIALASFIAEQPENVHLYQQVKKKVENRAKELRDELANSGLIISTAGSKKVRNAPVEELSPRFIDENADRIREAVFHNIGVTARLMPQEAIDFGMGYFPKLSRSLIVLGDMTNTNPEVLAKRLAATSGRNNWENNFNAMLLTTAYDDLMRRGELIPLRVLRGLGIDPEEAILLSSPTALVKSMRTNFPEVVATFIDADAWDSLGRSALKKRSFSQNSIGKYTLGTYDSQIQGLNLGRPAASPETPHMYMLVHDTTRDAYKHFFGVDENDPELFHGINSARWRFAQTHAPTAPGSEHLSKFIHIYENPENLVKLYSPSEAPPELLTLKRRPRKNRR